MSSSRDDLRRLYKVGRLITKHLTTYFFYDLLLRWDGQALPKRLRSLLEDLGPIFVKFGQAVSTRPELIPPGFARELKQLQDRVVPFPTPRAVEILEEDLGSKPEELFAHFNDKPMASASLAQVYKARLPEEGAVAVKVRRPRVTQTLAEDISILYRIARWIERLAPGGRHIRMVEAVREFERTINREINFCNEMENIQELRESVQSSWRVKIPQVYSDYSTKRVLTTEWLHGCKTGDKEELRDRGHDPSEIASRIGQIYLQQILVTGVFHVDAHPGNIFVLPGGKIGLVDFGTIGRLDQEERSQLRHLLVSAVNKDSRELANRLAELGFIRRHQVRNVAQELDNIILRYFRTRFEEIKMGRLLYEVLNRIVRRHQVDLPVSYLQLTRTAILAENICEDLNPDYRWTSAVNSLQSEALFIDQMFAEMKDNFKQTARILYRLPHRLDQIMSELEEGAITGPTRDELEEMLQQFSPVGYKAGLGIAVGAVAIGATMLYINNYVYLGISGFGLTLLGFLRLLLKS